MWLVLFLLLEADLNRISKLALVLGVMNSDNDARRGNVPYVRMQT